jgi:hypothetical protein
MSRFYRVCAVAAGVGFAGAVSGQLLTGLDGSRDSSTFAGKYEGNVLPQNADLGFVLVDPNNIYGTASDPASLGSSGGVDYLRLDTDTNIPATQYGDAYFWMKDDGGTWNPHDTALGGYTIELRAIVRATNSGQYGFAVREIDQNTDGLIQFFKDKIIGPADSAASGAITTPVNDDNWHTFRIATYSPDSTSAGQIFRIWRDGTEIAQVAQNSNYLGEQLWFGDLVSGMAEVNIDIDYLRWDTTGAYAPIADPGWAVNGSGDWNVSSNWVGGLPNGVGSIALFAAAIASPQTVYTNTAVTVGTLKFDNLNSYMITGQGSVTLQVATGTASVEVVKGSHKINLPSIFASDTNITVASGATLTISNPMTIKANKIVTKTGALNIQAPLTIETGGVLNLGAGPTATLFGAPSLASGAKVNVQNNSLNIDYRGQASPAATIKSQLTSGYNAGAWNGQGISSSSATSTTGLGWKETTATESILIKYTYYGDADLSGTVTSTDFNALVAGYGKTTGAIWSEGDFDYDGKVNSRDFNYLAGNFGATPISSASLGSVVPEPASAAILVLGALVARRRR